MRELQKSSSVISSSRHLVILSSRHLLILSSRHLLILSSVILFSACAQKPPEPTAAQRDSAPDGTTEAVSGVVRKSEVGIGCWQFIASDSTHYELRAGQAPEEILVDQKQVTLSLQRRPDLMSNCMVGQIVDVVKVE